LILTAGLAGVVIWAGDIDLIAPVITMFF